MKKAKQIDKTRKRTNKIISKEIECQPKMLKVGPNTTQPDVNIPTQEEAREEEAGKKRVAEKQLLLNRVFGTPYLIVRNLRSIRFRS